MSDAPSSDLPRSSWSNLFSRSDEPLFFLSARRRVRYVNKAFESVSRQSAESILHEYSHPRKLSASVPAAVRGVLQAIAPPREVMAGRSMTIRRPAPPARFGPPWWDVTFIPLRQANKLLGVIGYVAATGAVPSATGGKGLSEALIALRQRVIAREAAAISESDSVESRRLLAQVDLASKAWSPVWIKGEPGTGKESVARAIHSRGVSRDLAFVGLDCRGLQPYLIRSLLFGHNGLVETGRVGTLYLKRAESLPADLQVELCEWRDLLEDECRMIVGVRDGASLLPEFRATFQVLEMNLAPINDRRAELPQMIASMHPQGEAGLSPDAFAMLVAADWPGNVRQLRSTVRGAISRANGARVELGHLPVWVRRAATDARSAATSDKPTKPLKLDEVLEKVERRLIELALRKTRGDQTAAADLLGVYRSRLFRRVKALELDAHAAD